MLSKRTKRTNRMTGMEDLENRILFAGLRGFELSVLSDAGLSTEIVEPPKPTDTPAADTDLGNDLMMSGSNAAAVSMMQATPATAQATDAVFSSVDNAGGTASAHGFEEGFINW